MPPGHQPFRLEPALPAEHMRTYEIRAPIKTHFRPATCAEIQCPGHVNGWCSLIDETAELGQRQAHYIRKVSGRRFTERSLPNNLTEFTFEAGQSCFRSGEHQTSLERPPIYIIRDGDWRGNPRATDPRVHRRADDWVDDFANHQQGIADKQQEG